MRLRCGRVGIEALVTSKMHYEETKVRRDEN